MDDPAYIPTGLLSAEELAGKLKKLRLDLSAERINQLADSGHLACWRWNSGSPFFQWTETKEWFARNYLKRQAGIEFPVELRVLSGDLVTQAELKYVPRSLVPLAPHLFSLEKSHITGVYFLISVQQGTPVVVYVGQSTNVLARLHDHKDKTWDRTLVLPTPKSELLSVERAFIRHLNPPMNNTSHRTEKDAHILKKYCITPSFEEDESCPKERV